jgi:hypothetical protein
VSERDRVKASPAGSILGLGIGLAVPGRPIRFLVAEDRSARGARDQTDRIPACSRLAHESIRHRREQRGTAPWSRRRHGAGSQAFAMPDGHLRTALQRLITQRRQVEPLLAVRRVGQ